MDYTMIILSYTGIWLILFIIGKIFKSNKYGLVIGPFYLFFKTKRFNRILERIGSKKHWNHIWNISVIAGLGQLCFILISLTSNLFFLSSGGEGATPIIPLLPGITISWDTLPYILVSLIILLITHEAAHGIASVVEGVPLKSSGLFLAVIIPGAFVEPNERELEAKPPLSQMRIFSAGSFANITIGLAMILIVVNFPTMISPFYNSSSQGLMIAGLVTGGPAEKSGMQKWDVIFTLNNTPINDITSLTEYMNRINPNTTLTISSDRGAFTIITQPAPYNSSKALIGIYPFNYYPTKFSFLPKQLPYQIYIQGYWLNTLLVSIALINMIPIYPLDGGRYLHSLLKLLKIKRRDNVRTVVSTISLLILGLNIILSFSVFGFNKI